MYWNTILIISHAIKQIQPLQFVYENNLHRIK